MLFESLNPERTQLYVGKAGLRVFSLMQSCLVLGRELSGQSPASPSELFTKEVLVLSHALVRRQSE